MAPPACVCGADLSCLESGPPTFEFLANHGRITRLSVNLVQTVQTGVQTVEFRRVFVQTVQTIEKVFLLKKRKFPFHGLYGLYESPTVSNGLYNGLYTVCTFPVGKENTGTTHALSPDLMLPFLVGLELEWDGSPVFASDPTTRCKL